MTMRPAEGQAKVKVHYSGEPNFEPIKGTSIAYATNTRDKVIKLEGIYYLCLQGVWFMAPAPTGPWTTCMSVPQEIYTIPASSPVYNVTYVTQTANSDGTVQSSYTAGYLGAFVLGAATGAIVANGSGYWWPPYAYGGYYPYAATYGGAYWGTAHYNSATGAYGWSQTANAPHRSATTGPPYNPSPRTPPPGPPGPKPYRRRRPRTAPTPSTRTHRPATPGASPTAQWGSP